MKQIIFTSDRCFKFHDYYISHNQLLIRSPKEGDQKFNIDIIFFSTKFLQVPTGLSGITISRVEKDIANKYEFFSKYSHYENCNLFEIISGEKKHYIVAGFFHVFENELEMNETSLGMDYVGREKRIAGSHWEKAQIITWQDSCKKTGWIFKLNLSNIYYMNKNIISTIIGNKIEEIRIQSFYLDNELVSEINSVLIKLNTGIWYNFNSIDGVNTILMLDKEPIESSIEEFKDGFAYPIKSVNLIYIGKIIKNIREYSYKNHIDELGGFYIELHGELSFSIFNNGQDITQIMEGCITDNDYVLI